MKPYKVINLLTGKEYPVDAKGPRQALALCLPDSTLYDIQETNRFLYAVNRQDDRDTYGVQKDMPID